MYYSPTIFENAGMTGGGSNFWATAGVGIVNMLATIGATVMIDRVGRRKLLMIGAVLLTLFSALVSYGFASGNNTLLLWSIFAFVISYAISMGPVP